MAGGLLQMAETQNPDQAAGVSAELLAKNMLATQNIKDESAQGMGEAVGAIGGLMAGKHLSAQPKQRGIVTAYGMDPTAGAGTSSGGPGTFNQAPEDNGLGQLIGWAGKKILGGVMSVGQ